MHARCVSCHGRTGRRSTAGTSGDTRCRIARSAGTACAARHGQLRHRHAPDGGHPRRAGVRLGADRRCVAEPAADAARNRPAHLHGRGDCDGRRRAPAAADHGRPSAARHRLPDAGCQCPGEILVAARRPVCCGRDLRDRTGTHARPHRAHAARFRLRSRNQWRPPLCARRRAAQGLRYRRAGGRFLGGFLHGRCLDRAGLGAFAGTCRHQPHAHRHHQYP